MTSTPSALVGTAEGMAVLKMQRELSAASANLPARGDSSGQQDARKLAVLRRSLDSIAADFARGIRDGDIDAEQKYFLEKGDRERVEMRLRELEPQVKVMVRGGALSPMPAQPNAVGYLGVAAGGLNVSLIINGEVRVGYCDYPVIESVDPGSPAEKAGLIAGDTLLAYNGHDLRERDINISRLLVPGQVVRVTYRRGGRARELSVTVAKRPDGGQVVFITKFACAPEESRNGCESRTGRDFSVRTPLMGGMIAGSNMSTGARAHVEMLRVPPD
ncbi:MAG: PDZ domain-containing protein, partial [Gemmatimonadota bacterium]|nr:PDZ domain-containing protein [Gemmatimonadota bacterium]